ncbi:MAG: hypothetical protein V4543_06805 [Bacteroidota bacterium]
MEINKGAQGFDLLEHKLTGMLHEHRRLFLELSDAREALEKLREDKKTLRITIEKQRETIKNFQNQGKLDSIVGSIAMDAQGAEAVRQRIDEFIREIEKCIAYLNE